MKQQFHFQFEINEQAAMYLLTPGTLELINNVFCILSNNLTDKTQERT